MSVNMTDPRQSSTHSTMALPRVRAFVDFMAEHLFTAMREKGRG
jgi:hypothetical protein